MVFNGSYQAGQEQMAYVTQTTRSFSLLSQRGAAFFRKN